MLKKLFTSALVLVIMASTAFATEWKVDKTHSSVSFKVRHMVISNVKGDFSDFSGTVQFDGKDLTKATVEFSIDATTINTDNKGRDDHLKSDEFFETTKYPTITFKSTKIVADGDDYKITGDFTMKDVSKSVTFDLEYSGTVVDPWGNTRAGFAAKTKINRQDFNVNFSGTLDNGGLVVGNEVKIELDIEIVKAKESGEKK